MASWTELIDEGGTRGLSGRDLEVTDCPGQGWAVVREGQVGWGWRATWLNFRTRVT